jgi:hypothetical protein
MNYQKSSWAKVNSMVFFLLRLTKELNYDKITKKPSYPQTILK